MNWRLLPLLVLPLTGCLHLVAAPSPMKTVSDLLPDGEKARCLLVLLPGVADRAGTFRQQGFIDELRARGLSVDVVAADSTVGYYLRGIDAQRLHRDVVSPAKARGYEQTWMLGVSMGGFGTLHYAAAFGHGLDGVVALAPHLGEQTVLQTIRDAGGLARWSPPASDPFERLNHTEQTWSWLKAVTVDQRPGPRVYLGVGEADPLVQRGGLLAAVLPASQRYHDPGGHGWSTWRRMWVRFLDRSEFKERCGR